MDLELSREDELFREEIREWLHANIPKEGPPEYGAAYREYGLAWQRTQNEGGWAGISWPKEYGGCGLGLIRQMIWHEEYARAKAPGASVGFVGLNHGGPTLITCGSEAQKSFFLPRILNGTDVWCQGFSEPNAGSDLAGLQTRAVLDGDQYIVNGSKIWTTMANQADSIFCLVRTDPDAPKHDGISFLLFDLHQPGVTISPIRLISGQSDFCQVFFENAKAEAKNLVGPLNGGWTIAKRLLQHERQMLSGTMPGGANDPMVPKKKSKQKKEAVASPAPRSALAEDARGYLGGDDALAEPVLRDRIAQYELDTLCMGLTLKRAGEEAKAKSGTGAASSMFKLYASELNKRRGELQMAIRGAAALGWEGDGFSPNEIAETRGWLRSKGNSIEGGTSEVQLNVIAKRVLGLPD